MRPPYQHGEVFVTEDGVTAWTWEGHYERFVDVNLTRYATTPQDIYQAVLDKEPPRRTFRPDGSGYSPYYK